MKLVTHTGILRKFGDDFKILQLIKNAGGNTGHAMLVSDTPENLILNLGKRLGALHINDNDAKNDLHTAPYAGTVNWDNVISALKETEYSGNFTFEIGSFLSKQDKEFLPEALSYLEKLGRYFIRKIRG